VAIAGEEIERLRACMAELPDPYATVIRLRYWDDQTLKEIAETLGEGKSWVHRVIQKGEKMLRDCLSGKIP
jgi:RNA polymerase sigma factor (sigma-70 family)